MEEELATRIILPKMEKETENKMESKLSNLESKIICEERIQYVFYERFVIIPEITK